MANTYKLIASTTVGSGGSASVTFSSIPQTFTDLKILMTARLTGNGDSFGNTKISFNGSPTGTDYSLKLVRGDGNTSGGNSYTSQDSIPNNYSTVGSTATANTFSNSEIYIPNYTSSDPKSVIADNVGENNSTTEARMTLAAGLWNPGTQAAISSITLTSNYTSSETYAQYSTFYLYGIKNS